MDLLRGSAIILLLLWHSSVVPTQFGFEMPNWLFLLNEAFLPWRMPTLMFLSGLLLERSLRKSPSEYFSGKARNILWPYVIWAGIYLALYPGPNESITQPVAWFGAGYLWFIFYLMLYYCVAPLVVRVPWWLALSLFAVGSLLAPHFALHKILFFAFFFFAGHFFRHVVQAVSTMSTTWIAAGVMASVGFTAASIVLAGSTGTHYFEYAILTAPFVLAMIFLSIQVAKGIEKAVPHSRGVTAVSWIGRNSIVFYLAHVPIIRAICWGVEALGVIPGLWIVPLCLAASLACGAVLARLSGLAPISWLFRAPRLRLSASRPAIPN